jgi:tetratricopeptide (TPR) repeat protein
MVTGIRVLPLLLASSAAVAGAQAGSVPNQPAGVLQQARQLEDTHQLQQANEMLAGWIRTNPNDVEALTELGNVQLAQKLHEDAMKSFEQALDLKADSVRARDGEVRAAVADAMQEKGMGNDDAALIVLLRARKRVPDSPELLLDFGIQAEKMRIFRDADEALTKAHALAPDDVKITYALAHVEFDEQKMPQAEAHLRAYLTSKPNDATAHCGLGRLLELLQRDQEADVEFHKSIELQPQQTESYYRLGEMAMDMKEDSQARDQFETVLKLAPHHGGALTGMGILAFRAKDYAAAEGYLKSAVFYAADYPAAHHYYSLVLARLGRSEEAKHESDLALKLDQDQVQGSKGNFLTVIH